jgi:hypothetical protein
MQATLDTTQKFTVTLTPAVDSGSPGSIDAPPTYPVSVPGILTIIPSPDGLSAECRGNTVGTCTITPTDLAGGITIFGNPIDVTVIAPPLKPATKLIESIGPVVPQ